MKQTNETNQTTFLQWVSGVFGYPMVITLMCAIFLEPYNWRYVAAAILCMVLLVALLHRVSSVHHTTNNQIKVGFGFGALALIGAFVITSPLPPPWFAISFLPFMADAILMGWVILLY